MESIRPEDEQTYQLEEIWKTTAHTTAWPQTPDCPTVEPFRITLHRHQDLNIILRAAIAAIAEAGLHDDTDFAHLKTLPLIGSANATTILAAARDLRRFDHHRQFLEYCGFNLRKIQSGTRRGREPFSQRDNVRLRPAFWMARMDAV
ncbi:transposase [Burkholderia ambifaria]|uniref:transposase n=1 Tax=Burkholderia ambifaria TaxID=152480 RepID=UPI001588DF46|nr:transposase [Burkholderia ambifaria]